MNRKLIRPNFTEIKDKMKASEAAKQLQQQQQQQQQPQPQQQPQQQQQPPQKKVHPPTDTFAENYYYLKQMSKKTPMAVVFHDGQVIEGYIEWYDRNCIKLNRDKAANLLVFKSNIKYMYKLNENKDSQEPEKTDKK
ncbi:MAG: RNA chaperone Hfq [Candidatus Aminicenantes bacterium]|nr:RNA chaperone Hfq [Candidatus Aminicenantes bacterium]